MNHHLPSSPLIQRHAKPGMTLLELTVVILVLLSLITILFIGSRAWKAGVDRSACIMNIHNVQKGVRGYSNMYGFDPGDTAPGLLGHIIGYGKYVEVFPQCNTNGVYSFGTDFGADTIPPIGSLYMQCSLADSTNHKPMDYSEW